MKDDRLDFLADAVIAQEILLSAFIDSVIKFHPELKPELVNFLDTILKSGAIPSKDAKERIVEFRDGLVSSQPKPSDAH